MMIYGRANYMSDDKFIKWLAKRRARRLAKTMAERGESLDKYQLKIDESTMIKVKKRRKQNDSPGIIKSYKESLKVGGCVICGYKRSMWALVLHHIGRYKNAYFSYLVSQSATQFFVALM